MKNINPISSTTTYPESIPKYSLNEDGFLKQLNEAISASNQADARKEKPLNAKLFQDQIQLYASAAARTHNPTISLNAYKAQKSAVKSKTSSDF